MTEQEIRWQLDESETDDLRGQLQAEMRHSFFSMLRWPFIITWIAPILYLAGSLWQGAELADLITPELTLIGLGFATCILFTAWWLAATWRQRRAIRAPRYEIAFSDKAITFAGIKLELPAWSGTAELVKTGSHTHLHLALYRRSRTWHYIYDDHHLYKLPVPRANEADFEAVIALCGLGAVKDRQIIG